MTEHIDLIIIEDDKDNLNNFLKVFKQTKNIQVVNTASHYKQLQDNIDQYEFHVALVDMRIPPDSISEPDYKYGLEAISTISRVHPQAHILAITALVQEYGLVFKAIQAGAHGYMLKRGSHNEMLQAIYKVHNGEYVINSDIANLVLETLNNPLSVFGNMPPTISISHLTPREKEVLNLMRQGVVENEDLSKELGIEERSVTNKLNSILNKLHMSSRNSLLYELLMDRIRSEGMHSLEQVAEIIKVAAENPRDYDYDMGTWTIDSLTTVLLEENIITRSPFK